jgi:hypothetical protein
MMKLRRPTWKMGRGWEIMFKMLNLENAEFLSHKLFPEVV